MLVLSRKTGERIAIGGNVELTVVSVAGGKVKLGLSAPPDVAIRRAELLQCPTEASSRTQTESTDRHPVAIA